MSDAIDSSEVATVNSVSALDRYIILQGFGDTPQKAVQQLQACVNDMAGWTPHGGASLAWGSYTWGWIACQAVVRPLP